MKNSLEVMQWSDNDKMDRQQTAQNTLHIRQQKQDKSVKWKDFEIN